MHSERLLDHFQNPRNVGELEPPAITVEVENPACGDLMRVSIRIIDGRVSEARYRTRGCAASIAAGSALTELLRGKKVAELDGIDNASVIEALGGLIPESRHAVTLCVDAIREAVRGIPDAAP